MQNDERLPEIVGFYRRLNNRYPSEAIMLKYPDGKELLTTGLVYSVPSEEYMEMWEPTRSIDLAAMRQKIIDDIHDDPLFDVAENRQLALILKKKMEEDPLIRKEQNMKLVYICSPLRGNIEKNMKKAIAYCACAAKQGVIPIAPHTTFTLYLQDNIEPQREQGLKMGLDLLKRCDELWVCGDTISQGMKGEIAQAKEQNIPTRYLSDREIMEIELKNIEEEYGKMFFTRTEGRVSSFMFPDRAEAELSQEEVDFVRDYITDHMGSSQEQTQVQEEDFDMVMS